MKSLTVGPDRYFRSTETLNGFNREVAEAINAIAERLRDTERAAKRVSALVGEPGMVVGERLDLAAPNYGFPGTLTVGPPSLGSVSGLGSTITVSPGVRIKESTPPGRIAEFPKWVDTLPDPVVVEVRGLVAGIVTDIELLDVEEAHAPQSRVSSMLGKLLQILRVLAPFVPAAAVAENVAEKFLADGRSLPEWLGPMLAKAIAGIKDGTLNVDDAVAVLSTISAYTKGRG